MREVVKKIIDGEEYTFCQLPVKTSLKLLTRIVKLIGGSIGKGIGDSGSIDDLGDLDINVGMIISQLCEKIDDDLVTYIIDTALSQTMHSGDGEISKCFDMHFKKTGLPHLFKVAEAALEAEYGDFFGGKFDLAGLVEKGRAMIQGQQT